MKNVLIFVLLLIVAAFTCWVFVNPPKVESPIEKQAKENVKVEAEIISRKVDQKGIEAVIIEETEHVLKQAGLTAKADSAGIIDSLQKLANNRLISYTQARAEIKRLEAVMLETDTTFTYRDKWLSIDVKKPLGDKPALMTSTYNAELNWIWYKERKNWFSPLRTYGRFSLNDPGATITGLKHIRIEPPRDKLGFSVQAIGDYSPRGEVFGGIGVTLRTGRLNIQGAYMNDLRGTWYPSVRGWYNLVEW